ncbi:hypothetical protein [Raoultella terrigena]|uniref:hypothetical protein n=1 Tax=Raoultella terrigena TaxID=577 RepID=UPI001F41AE75|nr:hypothetical protein [Raoultella terrigena]
MRTSPQTGAAAPALWAGSRGYLGLPLIGANAAALFGWFYLLVSYKTEFCSVWRRRLAADSDEKWMISCGTAICPSNDLRQFLSVKFST